MGTSGEKVQVPARASQAVFSTLRCGGAEGVGRARAEKGEGMSVWIWKSGTQPLQTQWGNADRRGCFNKYVRPDGRPSHHTHAPTHPRTHAHTHLSIVGHVFVGLDVAVGDDQHGLWHGVPDGCDLSPRWEGKTKRRASERTQ